MLVQFGLAGPIRPQRAMQQPLSPSSPLNYGAAVPLVDQLPALEVRLRSIADADRANEMASYMKNHFTFLGVATPQRRTAVKEAIKTTVTPEHDDLVEAVDSLFAMKEREFHYVGVDLLRRWQRVLASADIEWLGKIGRAHV